MSISLQLESCGDSRAAPGGSTAAPLQRLRETCFEAVLREYNPLGFGEVLLARSVARHAADLLRDEHLADAAATEAEAVLTPLMLPLATDGSRTSPALLGMSDHLNEATRTASLNTSAFYRSLSQLMQLQHRHATELSGVNHPDGRFATEAQCIVYLARRFQLGKIACRRCGVAGCGSWIGVRRVWDCSMCHAQSCARTGTVMARSPLPLKIWFHAIKVLLYDPAIAAVELSRAIGVGRLPTVRQMARRIRTAILADDASTRLADLDHAYLPSP